MILKLLILADKSSKSFDKEAIILVDWLTISVNSITVAEVSSEEAALLVAISVNCVMFDVISLRFWLTSWIFSVILFVDSKHKSNIFLKSSKISIVSCKVETCILMIHSFPPLSW